MNNYKMIDDTYVAHTYKRFDLHFTHGEGCILYDANNKKYLDFTSGIGVNSLGHAHPKWSEAVKKQVDSLSHVSNLYYSTPMLNLAEKLVPMAKAQKVFFANSGAEANEGAIKVARKYGNDKYNGERYEIITLVNSFHGRTISTLSATGQDHFHQYFHPFTDGFVHAIANDMEDLHAKVNNKTVAIMFEIVQGEGGVLPLDKAYLDEIANICKEKDILMIIDEVQTGIGRCGTLLAYEQYGLNPDIVTLAKGLGGGLPIGAVLLYDKCKDILNYGDHGTTFGANPIACAGANVVIDHMTPSFLEEVNKKSEYVKARLMNMPHIKKVNGLGLMLGAELENIKVGDLIQTCINNGVVFLSAKANLRLLPPLIITMDELKSGMDTLEDVLTKWEI